MTPPKLVDRLVLLTGHAGAGKDTVGALLRMRGYRRFAFGDLVKDEIEHFMTMAGRKEQPHYLGMLATSKSTGYDAFARRESPWQKHISSSMRALLQYHGTEFRRAQDPDYWVKRLVERVRQEDHRVFRSVVITDARFTNELTLTSIARHAEVWRVTNPQLDLSAAMYQHASENAWRDTVADRLIDNRGTVYDLAELVAGALDGAE